MRRTTRRACIALALGGAIPVGLAGAGPAQAANYVTIMFSRAQVQPVVAPNCTALPQGVTIWQVARDLATRGYAATEAASTSLEQESGERCNANGDLTLGWDDLRILRSQYGWTVVPRGNRDDRALSTSEQFADSCGLLPTFYGEGFPDAWQMYAYYGGPYSLSMQTTVVAPCFSFGRRYLESGNTVPVPSPYIVNVFSINGGYCNNTALPCHSVVAPYQYTLPSTLRRIVQTSGWDVIQGYKFVSGDYSSTAVSWHCTGADPSTHWTSRDELYCYNDWQSVISSIPATSRVVSPSVVAAAQGRTMGGHELTVSGFTPAAGRVGSTVTVRGDGFEAADAVRFNGAAASFRVLSDTELTAVVPAAASSGRITVAADGALARSAANFGVIPTISGFSPAAGRVGTTVYVTGTGFLHATRVTFGGVQTTYSVLSSRSLKAIVPAGAPTGRIRVSTAGGTAASAASFVVR